MYRRTKIGFALIVAFVPFTVFGSAALAECPPLADWRNSSVLDLYGASHHGRSKSAYEWKLSD